MESPADLQSKALLLPWIDAITDSVDHYHGSKWSTRILPNNFLFYVRDRLEQLVTAGVTHNIHERHELVVALEGEGKVCIEETVYAFGPSKALLVKPGEFHRYYSIREPFRWLFFTFDLESPKGLLSNNTPVCSLTPADTSLLAEALKLQVQTSRTEFDTFMIAFQMGRLIRSMSERKPLPPLANDPEMEETRMLREVCRFVHLKLEEGVRITTIAEHLGISESSLRKVFRERYGISLGLYLQRSRLGRGMQLIDQSELPIKEIALRCGFESIFSFSHAFSKAVGMSPTAYRRYLADGGQPILIHTQTSAA